MGESYSNIGKTYTESGYDLYDKEEIEKSRGRDLRSAFLAAIGVCFRTSSLWDVWQQYRDEQELQDSLDEMHEMMDEQDEKNYVDENGYSYRYIYQPGETTDYGTDSLVGLSADEVYDRGEACDGVAHYEGVTSDELEADFYRMRRKMAFYLKIQVQELPEI